MLRGIVEVKPWSDKLPSAPPGRQRGIDCILIPCRYLDRTHRIHNFAFEIAVHLSRHQQQIYAIHQGKVGVVANPSSVSYDAKTSGPLVAFPPIAPCM